MSEVDYLKPTDPLQTSFCAQYYENDDKKIKIKIVC